MVEAAVKQARDAQPKQPPKRDRAKYMRDYRLRQKAKQ